MLAVVVHFLKLSDHIFILFPPIPLARMGVQSTHENCTYITVLSASL